MGVYFAPLEGVTDSVYRRTHQACFGGVEKYFIPFISPTVHLCLSGREKAAISPEENVGVPCVPQVMTKEPTHFLWAARVMADLGYKEINLNMGCPSGTVTAKGKGAGMLRDLESLGSFLDAIFACPPIEISIKTRIGYENEQEWEAICTLLSCYPAKEIIIHPRVRQEFYTGRPHQAAYALACEKLGQKLVYNGDLFSVEDCRALQEAFPGTHALMLGRGLTANPALARMLAGGAAPTRQELENFHDRLLEGYMQCMPKNVVLGRMREIVWYMASCFEEPAKPWKTIRKAPNESAYRAAVHALFSDCEMSENPMFRPKW